MTASRVLAASMLALLLAGNGALAIPTVAVAPPVIPTGVDAGWYARGVGGAAAPKTNDIPADIPISQISDQMPAGMMHGAAEADGGGETDALPLSIPGALIFSGVTRPYDLSMVAPLLARAVGYGVVHGPDSLAVVIAGMGGGNLVAAGDHHRASHSGSSVFIGTVPAASVSGPGRNSVDARLAAPPVGIAPAAGLAGDSPSFLGRRADAAGSNGGRNLPGPGEPSDATSSLAGAPDASLDETAEGVGAAAGGHSIARTIRRTSEPVVVAALRSGTGSAIGAPARTRIPGGADAGPMSQAARTNNASPTRADAPAAGPVALSKSGDADQADGRPKISAWPGREAGAGAANQAVFSLPDGSLSTVGYTYAPISRGTVRPAIPLMFDSGHHPGNARSGAIDSPPRVAAGSAGGLAFGISFGTVGYGDLGAMCVAARVLSTGEGGLAGAGGEQPAGSGADPSYFSIGASADGGGGEQVLLPIAVNDRLTDPILPQGLTIFAGASAAFGAGETFADRLVALAKQEPAFLAILGASLGVALAAGLAGLGSLRRRH